VFFEVGETDALSSIDSIVVDGEADEKSKVYSVWIMPSGKSAEICRKAIIDLNLGCIALDLWEEPATKWRFRGPRIIQISSYCLIWNIFPA
jgi:hypothetical protein